MLIYTFYHLIIVFERMHTISIVFHSREFYDVPWVLIADAKSFQALTTNLDYVTHLVSMSCWYRSDARQDEFRLELLYCEFSKYEVMAKSVVGGQPKKTCKYQLLSSKTHQMHFSNL